MKKTGRRLTALALAFVLAFGMGQMTAFASWALGTELVERTIPLAEGVSSAGGSLLAAFPPLQANRDRARAADKPRPRIFFSFIFLPHFQNFLQEPYGHAQYNIFAISLSIIYAVFLGFRQRADRGRPPIFKVFFLSGGK